MPAAASRRCVNGFWLALWIPGSGVQEAKTQPNGQGWEAGVGGWGARMGRPRRCASRISLPAYPRAPRWHAWRNMIKNKPTICACTCRSSLPGPASRFISPPLLYMARNATPDMSTRASCRRLRLRRLLLLGLAYHRLPLVLPRCRCGW
jgi:hypothetical protein